MFQIFILIRLSADILIGGDGKDNLAGGKGSDQFVINLNDSHIDKIKDFSNKDTIVITDSNFDNVELIPLETNQFTQDSSATTNRHPVLYDDGDIFWDSDGIGEAKPIKIANLSNDPFLQSSNILIESNP